MGCSAQRFDKGLMKHYLDEGLEENLAYDLEKGFSEDPEGSGGPQVLHSVLMLN